MAMNTMPVADSTPARMPPYTDVMPARYAVDSRASPPMRGERVEGDDAVAVGEQAAAEAGDERRDREARDLHRHDVDADAGGGSLVGADGEHRRTQRAGPQPGDAPGHDHEHDQAEQPELHAREGVAAADAEVEAEQLRLGHPGALGTDDLGVAEPHRLDGVGQGERDDAEGQAPQPQRGQPDHHADHRGHERGQQRRERERDAPALGEAAERERRAPASASWASDTWPA